jgi:nucleotide-binding universal stress UspA family protein
MATPHRLILVPIDRSDVAHSALQVAIEIAQSATGAKIRILHVVDESLTSFDAAALRHTACLRQDAVMHGEQLLAAACERVTHSGISVQSALRDVSDLGIAHSIVDEVGEAGCDLVVMGTHMRRGFSRLLHGSEAATLLEICPVPVVVIGPRAATTAAAIGGGANARRGGCTRTCAAPHVCERPR